MVKLLFVCTGNICRSPSAEAVFRQLVTNDNLSDDIISDSVGLHGFHVGEPADARAIATAEKRGYPMRGLRSRRIHPQDFETFDFFWPWTPVISNPCISFARAHKEKRSKCFCQSRPIATPQTYPIRFTERWKDLSVHLILSRLVRRHGLSG